MPRINEATDTDLKVIDALQKIGWKSGDTLLYQKGYYLLPEQQEQFEGKKSIKPDIVLQDLNGNILAVIENKFEDEKKALTKLRSLYASVLKPRFLYACSPERILFTGQNRAQDFTFMKTAATSTQAEQLRFLKARWQKHAKRKTSPNFARLAKQK